MEQFEKILMYLQIEELMIKVEDLCIDYIVSTR